MGEKARVSFSVPASLHRYQSLDQSSTETDTCELNVTLVDTFGEVQP